MPPSGQWGQQPALQAGLTMGLGSSLQVKLTEQGPRGPAKAKGLTALQPQEHPWRGGGVAGEYSWRGPVGGNAGQRPRPSRGQARPPRRAPPLPALLPVPLSPKGPGALSSPPHFHSPLPRRSAFGLGSPVRLRRLPPVPWTPRSSPCWPSCWLRSASATVSALGGGGWAGARLPAPGSRLCAGPRGLCPSSLPRANPIRAAVRRAKQRVSRGALPRDAAFGAPRSAPQQQGIALRSRTRVLRQPYGG